MAEFREFVIKKGKRAGQTVKLPVRAKAAPGSPPAPPAPAAPAAPPAAAAAEGGDVLGFSVASAALVVIAACGWVLWRRRAVGP